MIEWVLKTPVMKEFEVVERRKVLVQVEKPVGHPDNPGKLPLMVYEERDFTGQVVLTAPADRVRLDHCGHDKKHLRLSVRFFYGRMVDGKFQPANLDSGVIFGGPTYTEHGFHKKEVTDFSPTELLQKCAAVCQWDGELREVSAGAGAASGAVASATKRVAPGSPPSAR